MIKSAYNLMVINNFILHYTHDSEEMNCDEMYQAAIDYITEDHVDGIPADGNPLPFLDSQIKLSDISFENLDSK